MGDINGFLKIKRKDAGNRPVIERIYDYSEVEQTLNSEDRMLQASRCMDCGIPFCHWSCPVDNLIPEWNDLLYKGDWRNAYSRLAATNNFPEFTGRICPALCEHSCVLNRGFEPVTIRENEVAIIEKAFTEGYVKPMPPVLRTGKTVAIIGSGPAGLAAADILNKKGHTVTVFEKNSKAGGLLRYGIPDFKLNKTVIDRRLDIMIREGLNIRTGVNAGLNITADELLENYDAVCIATGSSHPRDLLIPGRELQGICFAMDYLSLQNKVNSGEIAASMNQVRAEGKKVVVIGGGDTGSDCIGTAVRQKAQCITQLEILPKPPDERSPENPWPYFAKILKTSSSHEEGCLRLWSVSARSFIGKNGKVTGIETEDMEWRSSGGKNYMSPVPGSQRVIEADLVLLAMGFVHPVHEGLIQDLDLELDGRQNIKTWNYHTSRPKVFAAGDTISGASLVVNAIASGRKAAYEIHRFLS